MRIGLRLLLAFLLVLGLALFAVRQVFLEEVKPGTQLAMEDSLVDTAYTLAQLAAPDLQAGVIATGAFAQALRTLPALQPQATLWGFSKTRIDTQVSITDARGTVVFDTRPEAIGRNHSRWNDVYLTLRGSYGARSTAGHPEDHGDTVMHVAAPVMAGERIIGVLTVSRPNRTLEPYIARSRECVQQAAWALLFVTLAVGGLLTWWIASSLQRLQTYALAVARGERAQPPRMGRFSGNTEFVDLASAVESMRLKLDLPMIPLQGSSALASNLLSGQISAGLIDSVTARQFSDRLAFLGVTGTQRLATLPDLPTLHEKGCKSFEQDGWLGILVPAATPPEVASRLASEMERIIKSPEVAKRIEAMGITLVGSSPAEFGKVMRSDSEVYGKVIKQYNIRLQ